MTGVVIRDSAQRRPSDKHRSDARNFLPHRHPLVPRQADRLAAVPCPVLPVQRPVPEPGRRGGHSPGCTNTALVHSISTEIFIEIAPYSALVLENAAQVSRMRPLWRPSHHSRSPAKATRSPPGSPSPSTTPTPLDDNDSRVRGLLTALLSRRAINGRNILPIIRVDHHQDEPQYATHHPHGHWRVIPRLDHNALLQLLREAEDFIGL